LAFDVSLVCIRYNITVDLDRAAPHFRDGIALDLDNERRVCWRCNSRRWQAGPRMARP
jgi:hypothetical protein